MKRLVPPDKAVAETQVGSRLYRQMKDGTVHANDADVKVLKEAGFFEPNAGGFAKTKGWVCDDCGFHGYFKVCGKCGSEEMKQPK
jgi:hypothetical protein